jgi:hypothetical protein
MELWAEVSSFPEVTVAEVEIVDADANACVIQSKSTGTDSVTFMTGQKVRSRNEPVDRIRSR